MKKPLKRVNKKNKLDSSFDKWAEEKSRQVDEGVLKLYATIEERAEVVKDIRRHMDAVENYLGALNNVLSRLTDLVETLKTTK